MMAREISLWGVGPKIAVPTVLYALLAGAISRIWLDFGQISIVPPGACIAAGAVLILVGLPMLVAAARAVKFAYESDSLATTGIFGIVRNPIYSAWIVFIIPGLALLSQSWPLLFTPLVAYLAFKTTIRRENEYLEKRFGDAYRKYKSEVNEIIPFPRRN